ncbi:MAG: SUMF1/EgtB/PvdO family nonheme iron enzyme [Pirellulales bacterium]|nr:SUMF1/EgtB/PvdO family nonheme iron enzyme [Pirellulales bacterium]
MRNSREWIAGGVLCLCLSWCHAAVPDEPAHPNKLTGLDIPALIPAPDHRDQWNDWREHLHRWRADALQALQYRGQFYSQPEFAWTSSVFCSYFAMLWDERLFDPATCSYRLDSFLDAIEGEFGPIDSLVIWHGYPNLGFDPKNQFDMYRNMPGGLDGLRQLANRLHGRNIRLFVCYNPWDTADGISNSDNLQRLVDFTCEVDADGIFLDTWKHGPEALLTRLDIRRPGTALESELELPLDFVATHHFSWAQWFQDSAAPGILRNKWFEPRHMMHLIRRWDTDHSGELHSAWMNGAGILVWENIFGSFNAWNPRDQFLLHSVRAVQAEFAHWFSQAEWTPLVATEHPQIYASSWTRPEGTLWTLINRSDETIDGVLLRVASRPAGRWFDLIRGLELKPQHAGETISVSSRLEPRGMGAIALLDETAITGSLQRLLDHQRRLHQKKRPSHRDQPTIRRITPCVHTSEKKVPDGMRALRGGDLQLQVQYRLRECGFYDYAPMVNHYHPDIHTSQTYKAEIHLKPYAIDICPVTNRQFEQFLDASGYLPIHRENFIKHWINDRPPEGTGDQPVVYVDLADARAYATFYGRRLPSEWEWQHAGEGGVFESGSRKVWNWTESVHTDGRTRFCMLKGGCDYRAEGSAWYADGGPRRVDFAAKYILTWPGLDRSATIGFRCAVDLELQPSHENPAHSHTEESTNCVTPDPNQERG